MHGLFKWLNHNSSAVQAISTVVLVFFTGWYAWLTRRLLSEGNRPFLHLELVPQDPGLAHLLVTNTGTAAAERITFKVHTDVTWRPGESWGGQSPFVSGLDYLAPGGALTFMLFLPSGIGAESRGKHVFDVEVKYRRGRRRLDTRAHFDLAQFDGTVFERDPSRSVTRAIESIARKMPDTTPNFSRPTRSRCPSCLELVTTGATKCRYCLSIIPEAVSPELTDEPAPAEVNPLPNSEPEV